MILPFINLDKGKPRPNSAAGFRRKTIMRFKLNFKVLALFISVTVSFVISLIIYIYISNKRFGEYMHSKEVEKLSYVADTLVTFYTENGGWGPLIENSELWWDLLERGWTEEKSRLNQSAINNELDNQERGEADIDYSIVMETVYYSNPSPLPTWDPLNVGPRVFLLDEDKNYIIGRKISSAKNLPLLEIDLEGKPIGWLGLSEGRKYYQPMDQAFSHNQSMLIIIIGAVFLIVLSAIAFLANKYMLIPITRLAKATKKVGHLNFNTRIPVESSDEIGELAAHFNDMAEKLEDYESKQKQWLTDISHELRTPLSALLCQIDALNDGIRKPNNALFLSLSNEIRRLIKLVNDINDISLIETGTFSIKKELLVPLQILSQEVHIFRERFESNNMKIEFDLEPEGFDIQIMGDTNRLKQVFTNILENAIRHTKKPGSLVIRQTRDAKHIKLILEDSGPGVPDGVLPFLFDRLYRLDSSRSRKTGGNGLGLAICKSIVEMHKGKIQAQNAQGGGFMIEILLPIENDPGDSIEELDIEG